MKKVICIDATPGKYGHAALLVEGQVYNASQSDHPDGYYIEGLRFNPANGRRISFKKRRFAPLSDISETEMEREFNSLKIKV